MLNADAAAAFLSRVAGQQGAATFYNLVASPRLVPSLSASFRHVRQLPAAAWLEQAPLRPGIRAYLSENMAVFSADAQFDGMAANASWQRLGRGGLDTQCEVQELLESRLCKISGARHGQATLGDTVLHTAPQLAEH